MRTIERVPRPWSRAAGGRPPAGSRGRRLRAGQQWRRRSRVGAPARPARDPVSVFTLGDPDAYGRCRRQRRARARPDWSSFPCPGEARSPRSRRPWWRPGLSWMPSLARGSRALARPRGARRRSDQQGRAAGRGGRSSLRALRGHGASSQVAVRAGVTVAFAAAKPARLLALARLLRARRRARHRDSQEGAQFRGEAVGAGRGPGHPRLASASARRFSQGRFRAAGCHRRFPRQGGSGRAHGAWGPARGGGSRHGVLPGVRGIRGRLLASRSDDSRPSGRGRSARPGRAPAVARGARKFRRGGRGPGPRNSAGNGARRRGAGGHAAFPGPRRGRLERLRGRRAGGSRTGDTRRS